VIQKKHISRTVNVKKLIKEMQKSTDENDKTSPVTVRVYVNIFDDGPISELLIELRMIFTVYLTLSRVVILRCCVITLCAEVLFLFKHSIIQPRTATDTGSLKSDLT